MKELWYDLTQIKDDRKLYLSYALQQGYKGIYIDKECLDLISVIPEEVKIIYDYPFLKDDKYILPKELEKRKVIIASEDTQALEKLKKKNYSTCYAIKVVDRQSMEKAITLSEKAKYILIEFEDVTNIPLELIVAFSQHNKCRVLKRVNTAEDGWIATMTMEEGSFGVLLSTDSFAAMQKLSMKIYNTSKAIELSELTVNRIEHIGMGDRVCIDTISKLKVDEGMLIGSTSEGGILVSSENHYLPYMDLRPFRVNAGAIHSYIFCENNKTKYLSELKAGDNVLVVDTKGMTRITAIGRVKIERRPMLMIECIAKDQRKLNVIVQDDWHIRLLAKGKVCNATELKKGDKLLGVTCEAGRHLGVKITETIVEK